MTPPPGIDHFALVSPQRRPTTNRLLNRIIRAARGQRDAMYLSARKMNLANDLLTVPTVVFSALLGSSVLTSRAPQWLMYTCSILAFLNVVLLTVQKVTRPGEYGQTYQTYGRKWEIFVMNAMAQQKWGAHSSAHVSEWGAVQMEAMTEEMIERYNEMIDQSPLLPRWALTYYKESNEDLSSDDDDDAVDPQMAITTHQPIRSSVSLVPSLIGPAVRTTRTSPQSPYSSSGQQTTRAYTVQLEQQRETSTTTNTLLKRVQNAAEPQISLTVAPHDKQGCPAILDAIVSGELVQHCEKEW